VWRQESAAVRASFEPATAAIVFALPEGSEGLGPNIEGLGEDYFVSIENITGGTAGDQITGNSGANTLTGLTGNDTLVGGDGSGLLAGGADFITGGLGRDVMTGASGNDRYDFNTVAESGTTAATRDVIIDFAAGTATTTVDRIDVSTIDANTTVAGNQSFLFGRAFTAGHLRAVQ
jgi:Ca2+-binding RTX toxin-like protein